MTKVKFHDYINKNIKYVVIAARYNDSWIFCKNKSLESFEIPGGKVEENESIIEAAKRELEEETGAFKYDLKEVIMYSVEKGSDETFGMLFFANIHKLGPLKHEIKEIILSDTLPYDLTYPKIQPYLFRYILKNVEFNPKTELRRMLSEKLYFQPKSDLVNAHRNALRLCQNYNNSNWDDFEGRYNIIKELFGSTKDNFYIEPTIHCDYGFNIHIGDNFYANFDTIFLDVNTITFGDNVFIAPRCSFFTAGHPIDKDIRNMGLEYGFPIRIGNDVWIGGNTVVNPGVNIGNNVVIGSGSVVTKDIPDGVVAAGNPCKVIRKITEKDKEYWNGKKEEYMRSL